MMPRLYSKLKFLVSVACLAMLLGVVGCSPSSYEHPTLKVVVDAESSSLVIESKELDGAVAKASFADAVVSSTMSSVQDDALGAGAALRITHESGDQTTLRMFDEVPFLLVDRTKHNKGTEPFVASSLDILQLDVAIGDQALTSFGSGGLREVTDTQGSYSFHALVNGDSRNGLVTAALTHHQGVGVFQPGAGGKLGIKIDFGRFQVDPGESRATDTIAIGFFEDARIGLEKYADAIAQNEGIEIAAKPNIYCTWYHSKASDEVALQKNTEFADAQLKPYGLDVIQIDDCWQSLLPHDFEHEGEIPLTGPIKVFVDVEENYSKGMDHTAEMISSHGMTPGIWFMPFAGNFENPYFDHDVFAKTADGQPYHDSRWSGTCVDATSPKGEAFIFERSKRIYDWGYRYFKIDGLHTGMPSKNIYINTEYKDQNFGDSILHDPTSTHIQAYRKGLQTLRKAAPDVFVLGCNVSQNFMSMGPAIGLMEAMRIGPDNGKAGEGDWREVTLGAWHGTNLYFLNGRVWHNDPDPIYVREENPIDRARWMCSWLAVSGAMHSSSEQYDELSEERLDLLRRCLPMHELAARPVDLLEKDQPEIWLVQNDRLNVVGLFNWKEKQATQITYDMGKLGLEADKTYVGFDFWANEFVDAFSGNLDQTLPAAQCRVLALRAIADHPQLVSTSRHITQGLIDVVEEQWLASDKQLTGKSQVVGGDAYELRIVLPSTGEWKASGVEVSQGSAKIVAQDGKTLRVEIQTADSAEVSWKVTF